MKNRRGDSCCSYLRASAIYTYATNDIEVESRVGVLIIVAQHPLVYQLHCRQKSCERRRTVGSGEAGVSAFVQLGRALVLFPLVSHCKRKMTTQFLELHGL